MTTFWKPSTETPSAAIASCVIAHPPEHEDDVWCLASEPWYWSAQHGNWQAESGDATMLPGGNFCWALEDDVLQGVDAAYSREVAA